MDGEAFKTVVAWVVKQFEAGQGLALVVLGAIVVLSIYLMSLLLLTIVPMWRQYRSLR